MSRSTFIIKGFGRQKVFAPVGRYIYSGAHECKLGDKHVVLLLEASDEPVSS